VYADSAVVATSQEDSTDRHLLLASASICALPLPTFAVASTAAAVHGLPFDRRLLDDIHLVRHSYTDVRALHRRVRQVSELPDVHVRTHHLDAAALGVVNGIPTVSPAVAAVTCAAQSSEEWALAVLDAAAWQTPEKLDELASITEDWPLLRGIGTVRAILPSVRVGAQTPLESLSRYRLVRQGLPEPELQLGLYDNVGLIGYADMTWRQLGVVGEADGLQKYSSRDDVIAEKAREDRIRALGYVVVRWTWGEIIHDSASVARRIHHGASVARRRAG
jgi:hypothetical protein